VKWIDSITSSKLHLHIDAKLRATVGAIKRPMIAVIDTGYDSLSHFISKNKHKSRLNLKYGKDSPQYHWKDFWGNEDAPRDDDGHGTSMLSTVMRVAPFADVCVARVASVDNDLRVQAKRTSDNLAKVVYPLTTSHYYTNAKRVTGNSMGYQES
jgi:hypothetical protein